VWIHGYRYHVGQRKCGSHWCGYCYHRMVSRSRVFVAMSRRYMGLPTYILTFGSNTRCSTQTNCPMSHCSSCHLAVEPFLFSMFLFKRNGRAPDLHRAHRREAVVQCVARSCIVMHGLVGAGPGHCDWWLPVVSLPSGSQQSRCNRFSSVPRGRIPTTLVESVVSFMYCRVRTVHSLWLQMDGNP